MDSSQPPPNLSPTDPEAQARSLRNGNADGLGPWYASEYPQVHRLCLGFLGSRPAADDLAQDAMIHLSEQLHHWHPEHPYAPWRNRVVVNLCRDRLRSNQRRNHHENVAAQRFSERSSPESSEQAQAQELRNLLEAALTHLAPREREAFVLIDMEGFRAVEAAQQLELSPSTLRASLSMARRKLRELLAQFNPEARS